MNTLQKLIRNRNTEEDVRGYLQRHGYLAQSAKFEYLELTAIERPGWVQVFQFCVRVLDIHQQPQRLFGVACDDDRRGIRVFLTTTEAEQSRVAEDWSTGLINLDRERSKLAPLFLVAFAVVMGLAILGALLSAG